MKKVRLDSYRSEYHSASTLICVLWYVVNRMLFKTSIPYPSTFKTIVLRLFGAKAGRNITIKPCVNIKYPWKLELADNIWIGEDVWIDNLASVFIASNVCISQGAMLLTGNHNYKSQQFDLIIGEIKLDEGVWIGAKSVVCPGVQCASHSVLTVNSVASKDLAAYGIYQGNPAIMVRKRII